MHIPDEIAEKDLSLDELGAYVRLLYHCQKSPDKTYHGGYDDLKQDLLMGVGGQRQELMQALQALHDRGLIQIDRTDGIWHLTLIDSEVKE